MQPAYDILRQDAIGPSIWVEAAATIDDAKARILHHAERFPADYVIFHSPTSQIVANFHFKQNQFCSPQPEGVLLQENSLGAA
jgi:hypothetical protein